MRLSTVMLQQNTCEYRDPDVPYILESNPHLWEDDGEDKDDSDWVTDNNSVMSVDGESDE